MNNDGDILIQAWKKVGRRREMMDRIFKIFCSVIVLGGAILFILCIAKVVHAEVTEVSFYTVKSCLKEGTSGIMANGKALKDEELTCASWDYSFGTKLRLSKGNKSVVVVVSDRGPSKRLYKAGRKIDLSKAAFERLASCKQGIIKGVIVEVI